MVSKVFLSIFATLLVAQLVLADPLICPDPEAARVIVYNEELHIQSAEFGRTEKVVFVPATEKPVSCITVTELAGSEFSGSVSIASIGLSDKGTTVRLVSNIKQGIDVLVDVYTE